MRNHFKHSVELVDGEGDIVDVLGTVEDFLLAQATYQDARQRWPKERIRLSQQTRIVEDSSDPHEQRGAVALLWCCTRPAVVILLIILWGYLF